MFGLSDRWQFLELVLAGRGEFAEKPAAEQSVGRVDVKVGHAINSGSRG
jgi:hypothetical protein